MLLAGAHAADLLRVMQGCGMSVQVAGAQVGEASAMKMVRSVMIKGLEALSQECFLAARAAGIEERIIASPDPVLSRARLGEDRRLQPGAHGQPWHPPRAEMREVAATLEELGVER